MHVYVVNRGEKISYVVSCQRHKKTRRSIHTSQKVWCAPREKESCSTAGGKAFFSSLVHNVYYYTDYVILLMLPYSLYSSNGGFRTMYPSDRSYGGIDHVIPFTYNLLIVETDVSLLFLKYVFVHGENFQNVMYYIVKSISSRQFNFYP